MKLSINTKDDYVWVKLTQAGWKKVEKEYSKKFSKSGTYDAMLILRSESKENNGFLKFALFYLMETFGKYSQQNIFVKNLIHLTKPY